MQDAELIALFAERNERAIAETNLQYGKSCRSIAAELTRSRQDAEEIVNDVLMEAWNTIPPQKPRKLFAYLAAITRNLAMHRLDERNAQRRGGGHVPAVLDELSECIASSDSVEETVDGKLLTETIARFLDTLPKEQRIIFMLRYYYAMPLCEIAARKNIRTGTVKAALARVRKKLNVYLKKEGFL